MKKLLCILLTLALTGCTSFSIKGPDGTEVGAIADAERKKKEETADRTEAAIKELLPL